MSFGSQSSEGSAFLSSSTNQERQHLYAGFLNFTYTMNQNWNMSGGMRVENTAFDYKQNGVKIKEQSKTFSITYSFRQRKKFKGRGSAQEELGRF